MELFEWSETYKVGNIVIDNQHKKLVELTNNLIQHANAKTNSKIIGETLDELLKYINSHFEEEEKYLKSVNFPHFEEHCKVHVAFREKVAYFCGEVIDGNKNVSKELIRFLTDYVANHVFVEDQDIKSFCIKTKD